MSDKHRGIARQLESIADYLHRLAEHERHMGELADAWTRGQAEIAALKAEIQTLKAQQPDAADLSAVSSIVAAFPANAASAAAVPAPNPNIVVFDTGAA